MVPLFLLDRSIRFVRFAFITSILFFLGGNQKWASAQIMAAPPLVEKDVIPIPGSDEFTIQITVQGAGNETVSTIPVSAVISLDRSGSMAGQKIVDATNAAIAFVEALSMAMNGDQASIVSWNEAIIPTLTSPALTTNLEEVIDLINSTTAGGGTNLNVGLERSITLLEADTVTGALRVIIFLTDGVGAYTSAADGGPAADAAQEGYKIYSIGVGPNADEAPLEDMANATGGIAFPNITSDNLEQIFMDIFMDVVSSTIPRNVNVVETTLDYIVVDCDSANPPAVTCERNQSTGTTTLTWDDIGTFADGNTTLKEDEIVVLTFEATSTMEGDVPVNDPEAQVTFEDSSNNVDSVPIPQAFYMPPETSSAPSAPSETSSAPSAASETSAPSTASLTSPPSASPTPMPSRGFKKRDKKKYFRTKDSKDSKTSKTSKSSRSSGKGKGIGGGDDDDDGGWNNGKGKGGSYDYSTSSGKGKGGSYDYSTSSGKGKGGSYDSSSGKGKGGRSDDDWTEKGKGRAMNIRRRVQEEMNGGY